MTFNAASYFAGVGTVLATLTLGFGGGILMSGVFTDKVPREPNRVERQIAEKAKPEAPPVVTTTPVVVPTAPKNETIAAAPPATPPPEPQKEPAPPAAPPAAPQAQPEPQPQVTTQVVRHPPPAQGRERPVALVDPAIREQIRVPHDERAQDLKRQAAEKRKAEREKQRAERRRQQQLQEAERRRQMQEAQASAAQRSRAAEVDDEEREERPVFGARERPVFVRPERPDFPRPRIFPWFGDD
jgi:hypothetical protein